MNRLISFDPDLYAALKAFADKRKISFTSVVEWAVYEFLREYKSHDEKEEFKGLLEQYEVNSKQRAKFLPKSKKYNPVTYGQIE